MPSKLLHIFRNTPLGRETLLQSIYFCQRIGCTIEIYLPESSHLLMYFDNSVSQIDLDTSYLHAPETARHHASDLVKKAGLTHSFFTPKNYTASTLPDIPVNYDYMCCPRSISDLSSKIGLGYIGPRVRHIVQSARFPVLLTSAVYKPWKSITVFYGGSVNAGKAMRLGMKISKLSAMPLKIFTHAEKKTKEEYLDVLKMSKLKSVLDQVDHEWLFFDQGNFEDNLYEIPHDTLVILGAYGHGVIRDFVFGSKMEKIQATIPNNLLIVGPNYYQSL